MPFYVNILILCAVLVLNQNMAAQTVHPGNVLFKQGIRALNENQIDSAEIYFRESVKKNSDAESFFNLASINEKKNTVHSRMIAREYIEKAILRDSKNIKYKFFMAELAERISPELAARYYKDIIEIDSTNSEALYNIGRIEEQRYEDYNNSVSKQDDDIELSLASYAEKIFNKAENYLSKAIRYDSLNRKAYLHLGFLFEDKRRPDLGIPLLEKMVHHFPDDKDAHLYLGLLYYENSKIKEAFQEYQASLILMNENEKQDFIFNSVKDLLEPVLGKEFKSSSNLEIRNTINYFWKFSDPLFLTDYNERLLEHYSRVAYANLRFGVKSKNIPGWKTDRGEMIIRYGWPNKKVRYRPKMDDGESGAMISMKTDVWYYDNFILGFTDQFMSGNFVFSEPDEGKKYASQFPGETNLDVTYFRRAMFSSFKPRFEGPTFNIPLKITQFKNFEKGNYGFTDIYVNYGIEASDSSKKESVFPYEWGLFFFDRLLNPVHRDKGTAVKLDSGEILKLSREKKYFVNSRMMTLWPDSGELAFEIIRAKDKGVFSNHIQFSIKKFGSVKLDISDLTLAYNVDENGKMPAPIRRSNLSIYPNPSGIFNSDIPLFIYYEIYNLSADQNGMSDFEQRLILRKKETPTGLAQAVNTVLNALGIRKGNNEIIITTNYTAASQNPGIYFQIDMSKYQPGDYELIIEITDKKTGATAECKTNLKWE